MSEKVASDGTRTHGDRPRWLWIALAGLVAVAVTLVAALVATRIRDVSPIDDELTDSGRVLLLGEPELASRAHGSTEVVRPSDVADVEAALDRDDPAALVTALEAAEIDAILVGGRERPAARDVHTRARLARYEHVPGLRGSVLTPLAAVYVADESPLLTQAHASAVAHVARGVLAGDRPPRVASFPEPLRRVENVEVMVLLRENGDARLWRSARGSSFARALVTAATVARQRWEERERAMGGPLSRALPRLDVEVVRLAEDGTLAERTPGFVDRVFTEVHGVAFEDRGSWHYLLPDVTHERGRGSAMRAYAALFSDTGYEEDALSRSDLRPYRLVAIPVAVSLGAASPSGGEPGEEADGEGGTSAP